MFSDSSSKDISGHNLFGLGLNIYLYIVRFILAAGKSDQICRFIVLRRYVKTPTFVLRVNLTFNRSHIYVP